MRHTISLLAILLACSSAQAVERRCKTDDLWRGPDKTKHAVGGALIGSSVTYATKDPFWGSVAATTVAGAKELIDRRTPSRTCSFQDFAVTAAAGIAASYGTALVILPAPDGKGVQVAYSVRLR